MFHPQKTVAASAAEVRRALKRLARPASDFDSSRYFRGGHALAFHNVGTGRMRALAREVYAAYRDRWTIHEAMAFAR